MAAISPRFRWPSWLIGGKLLRQKIAMAAGIVILLLYFIGLFQPVGCIWPLADYQAKLACLEILGRYRRPDDLKSAIQYEIDHPHFDFEGGQRHAMEVDYHGLRNELKAELRKAGVDIGAPPAGDKNRYKSAAGMAPALAAAGE